MPKLYIIVGLPASGKSAVAAEISKRLRMPFISKDELKEVLFDEIGSERGVESAKRIDGISYKLLFAVLGKLVQSKTSVIVESDFTAKHATQLEKMTGGDYEIIQIRCQIDKETMLRRFKDRWESGSRHLGHYDDQWYEHFEKSSEIDGGSFLPLKGERVEIDTTKIDQGVFDNLMEQLQNLG